jgi:hypothetical protein
MVGCFGVLFFLHSGATDDVCNICYVMLEEAIQVLFSIYYNKKLTVRDWSLLPPDIVELDTPEAFKARIVSL